MKQLKLITALSLCFAGAGLLTNSAEAAGPLFLCQDCAEPTPLAWDTSNGPIPVYTDGGEAFAYDFDGVTVFLSIDRANEITQYAFDEWNAVSTSTFEANVAGSYADATGGAITDITGTNAADVYTVENGYGFWVNYDTDGSILSDFFGVGSGVLGIAFPEWANAETGEITEATAVINGVAIWENDTEGNVIAGVFTHEFGHAINLSHSQTNGDIFFAPAFANRQAGPRNCAPFPNPTTFEEIETMFPFISIYQFGPGEAQSTVNLTDDRVAISNLYPTADYSTTLGSITGTLTLKDGKTEYSGINVVARNVNNWFGDAVSAMTGDQTQGTVGPDGRYTINGLTPGEEYVVYIESIWAGGFPTTPMPIVSQAEFWNAAESNNPAADNICDSTPILAEAGVTKTADIVFNGYLDGIQYTPVVSAFLTDIAKNGKSSAGQLGQTAFKWDENHDFAVLPPEFIAGNVTMNRNGMVMNVQHDDNNNGIGQASLFKFTGNSGKGSIQSLGDLNGDSCGGVGQAGTNATYGWDMDADASTVVGLAYIDTDGDGGCTTRSKLELVPFIWTDGKNGGMRQLSLEGLTSPSFVRAHSISGNGKVALGTNGGSRALAWVEEGPMIDLFNDRDIPARDAFAINYEGDRVALGTFSDGPILWNPYEDSYTEIGSLTWCVDVPFIHFFLGNLCEAGFTPDEIEEFAGPVNVLPTDMNDAGSVIIGRAGSFFTGFTGALWVEGLGWMSLGNVLKNQGVAEAFDFPMDNPISIDGSGDKLVGGLAGATVGFHVDMSEVFVCQDGVSISTTFPEGVVELVNDGAEFGRCEFLD